MLSESYRTTTDFKEILRTLQKSSSLRDNLLWQTTSTGKKMIFPQHLEIDFVTRGVAIFFDTNKFSINPQLPLYVKLEYRQTIFKLTQFQLGPFGVHFPFPSTIKSKELRGVDRFTFTGPDDKFVCLRPTLNSQPHDSGSEIQVRLMDVSPEGVGMMISENNRSFLKNNKFLWLSEMAGHKLYDPILAEVVYMTGEIDNKFYKRKQKELKVGLKLSTSFPSDFYQKLVK